MNAKKPSQRVFVVGVGMTKFSKPQKDPEMGPHYPDLVQTAVTRALKDACLSISDVEMAVVGKHADGTTGAGQRSLHSMGFYDIPIINVANACATGSNAVYLCRQMVQSGTHDCCLAVGVEKMAPGSLDDALNMPGPGILDDHRRVLNSAYGLDDNNPQLPQLFASAARDHMKLYGSTAEHYAMIGEKNHRHSYNNPYSQFRDVYSLDDVSSSRMVSYPITKLQCSPTSNGAAAALLCSLEFVQQHGLEGQAVEVIAQSMKTEVHDSFLADIHERSCMQMIGFPMARNAAQEVFKQSGLTPNDVQVIELHDCFSANELLTYEALGLCAEGKGAELISRGETTYGGRWVVNPSGGLISKGHPIGATGVAQCCELSWQLRNECGPRQVPGAKVGLQHNLGLPGNCVVTLYRKPDEWATVQPKRVASGAMGFVEDELKSKL